MAEVTKLAGDSCPLPLPSPTRIKRLTGKSKLLAPSWLLCAFAAVVGVGSGRGKRGEGLSIGDGGLWGRRCSYSRRTGTCRALWPSSR